MYLATDPLTAYRLMEGQLGDMRRRGYEVSVITGPGELLEGVAQREQVQVIGVPMAREVAPLRDVVSLLRLVRLLRALRPDVVNAGTPKAGLLGVVAARLVGVPCVIYWLRGLRFESSRGLKRLLLVASEHVAGGLADQVFCNSRSLRERFISLGCARRLHTFVPAGGSSNGVDLTRFAVTEARAAWAAEQRAKLGISARTSVIGFVGRFTRDKGIAELVEAFARVQRAQPDVALLLVGDYDATDPVDAATRRVIGDNPRVFVRGFLRDPSAEYALMDLLAFPSHREGLPNVPLEAAAAGLPCVGFRATGTVDAVVDGVTGVLVPIGDVAGLTAALLAYIEQPELRRGHGAAARARVQAEFKREVVWDAIARRYDALLSLGAVD